MFPQHCAVWEFIINLLGDWDICQQHELLHHGVCLPDSQEMSLLGDTTKLKEDTGKLKLFWKNLHEFFGLEIDRVVGFAVDVETDL